jgi:hypothetical protein
MILQELLYLVSSHNLTHDGYDFDVVAPGNLL